MPQRKGANSTYFGNLWEGVRSSWIGLRISLRHFRQASQKHKPINVSHEEYFDQKTGVVTLQYPYEAIPVPDNGRYRLHNEMDDCIVCDKCAKVCPVNCIDIEPIKATELVGTASDGSPIRLYAAKFDIDMAKCCYCGLCTTVCPTDCLTMTKTYDFSETNVDNMLYHFANLSPDEAQEKIDLLEIFQKEKAESILVSKKDAEKVIVQEEDAKAKPRPKFVPKIKAKPTEEQLEAEEKNPEETPKPRPKFVPKMKAKPAGEQLEAEEKTPEEAPKPRPKFVPKMKAKPTEEQPESLLTPKGGIEKDLEKEEDTHLKPRPKFVPKMKAKPKDEQ